MEEIPRHKTCGKCHLVRFECHCHIFIFAVLPARLIGIGHRNWSQYDWAFYRKVTERPYTQRAHP